MKLHKKNERDLSCLLILARQSQMLFIGMITEIEQSADKAGAIGRALPICGDSTVQEPEFEETDRLADAPGEAKHQELSLVSGLVEIQHRIERFIKTKY